MENLGETPIRKCIDCGLTVRNIGDMGYFVKAKNSKYGRRNLCINCAVKRNKKDVRNKDWKTDHQTKKRYGIDVETYKQRMSSKQSCDICDSTKELCYDHDHDTMEFRGVLCRGCNRSLGQLGDSLEGIMKVVNYLKKETH